MTEEHALFSAAYSLRVLGFSSCSLMPLSRSISRKPFDSAYSRPSRSISKRLSSGVEKLEPQHGPPRAEAVA
jgi:hypothetical protein